MGGEGRGVVEHVARISRLATTSGIPKNDETPRKIVNATIGHEDYQTRWQAKMLTIRVGIWVTDKTIGQVTVVSDAEGKLCDLVKLKAKCQVFTSLAKENCNAPRANGARIARAPHVERI